MRATEYASKIGIEACSEVEKATYLAFYLYKEEKKTHFGMSEISDAFTDFGLHKPNSSRLKTKLLSTKYFKPDKEFPSEIKFTDIGRGELEEEQKDWWNDFSTIESNSELLDEAKFCGKRDYLDSLIRQINHSYAHNCYDAAAVLMRRLFELLLILSYQVNGIEEEIKSGNGSYKTLNGIIANAKNNSTLKLSKIRDKFDRFRDVGNYSAHGIFYIASIKDIDDIKFNYRVTIEELYNKAGLMH